MDESKQHISNEIKRAIKRKNLSLRKTADQIEGMSYSQISRVMSGENYTIDTLLKIVDVLDLEIIVKEKVTS